GTEVMDELVTAVRKAVPGRRLIVGSYNCDPTHPIYNSVLEWKKLYPKILDVAMMSRYVQGDPQKVAETIRFDYDAMQTKQIIPWLTAGALGEYDPKCTEPMILEAILKGARGVTYYWFGDFDPMDLYYHTKAIGDLKPYEKLLQAGKPVEYKG